MPFSSFTEYTPDWSLFKSWVMISVVAGVVEDNCAYAIFTLKKQTKTTRGLKRRKPVVFVCFLERTNIFFNKDDIFSCIYMLANIINYVNILYFLYFTKVIAVPVAPPRAVRPIRCI